MIGRLTNDTTKLCIKCKIPQDAKSFSKDKSKIDGLCPYCKCCVSEINKQKRLVNRDHINKIKRDWTRKNRGRVYARDLVYKKNNSEKVKTMMSSYRRRKRKESPQERMVSILRSKMAHFLRRKRPEIYSDFFACSSRYFRIHLESQFDINMNWGNYGKYWNIDHEKPLSSFDLTNKFQQKECFHYTNCRPMLVSENCKKRNKIEG